MQQRFFLLRIFFFCWFFAVGARLLYWQVVKAQELQEAGRFQYQRQRVQVIPRGKIFTAEGYPLALREERFNVIANPSKIEDTPLAIASLLTPFADFSADLRATDSAYIAGKQKDLVINLTGKLSDKEKKWTQLLPNVSATAKKSIQELDLAAITFEPVSSRYYPEASLSAHLLGFVGKDEQGQAKGYFGVEGYYDRELRTRVNKQTQYLDAAGQPISFAQTNAGESVSGRDLYLTIHHDIQFIIEKNLQEGIQKYGAKSGDVLLMEPGTGKILAMASYPTYNPSLYTQSDPSFFKNPSVADSYEPGSTFKVLTVAAGIDAGVISPDTQCDSCSGPVTIGQYTIKTWDDKYHAGTTIQEGLTHSDNTAMVYIGKKVGKEKFLEYLQNFGVGTKTGVDLQDEASPKFRPLKDWSEIDVATATFGQGIALTPIQMLSSVNSIANDGVLMRPYVVEKVKDESQEFITKPQEIRRVVSKETAETVTTMMQTSASQGDARWTLPRQFPIAGKTGTAQIPVSGHYDAERTIASFVGFAPADNPKFTMLVRLVEPTSSQWGSETAAPLWFTIAKELFVKYGIQPEKSN